VNTATNRAGGTCPECGRPADDRYRPFCGRGCANADLNRWLDEGYRIPTEETPGAGTPGEEA